MDISDYAREYEESTQYFFDLYATLSPSNLDMHQPDGWTPRQVIHHMADSETQSHTRIRRIVAEPEGSTIQGYDEAAWARHPRLGYTELPIEHSIALIKAVRASSLDIVSRLTVEDLEKYGMHTDYGRFTMKDWLRAYTNHPREHGDQMMKAIGK